MAQRMNAKKGALPSNIWKPIIWRGHADQVQSFPAQHSIAPSPGIGYKAFVEVGRDELRRMWGDIVTTARKVPKPVKIISTYHRS
ncbi:hypothetical protein CFR78_15925 [Komagataeibacter rhaeticus]|nr:hypothetical protein GLUCORHAEAF1_13605 [Komagataeibacter rhaeticus AF1]PYD52239.1 hypothetical protein CFR78_15925 [Komagataeibacter rhaeticus]